MGAQKWRAYSAWACQGGTHESRSCKRNIRRHGSTGYKPQKLALASRQDGGDLKNQTMERLEPKPSEDLESRSFG